MVNSLSAMERVCFNPNLGVQVNVLLQQGVDHYASGRAAAAEACFAEAIRHWPQTLEAYLAQYKFFVTERRLDEALQTIIDGLAMAAGQGGFAADWRLLGAGSADWSSGGAPRFFLYTLKALAFVQMRREQFDVARAALDKLALLDPLDQVGGSVLQDLLLSIEGDHDADT